MAAATLDRRRGEFESSLRRLREAEGLAARLVGLQSETLAGIRNDLGATFNGLGRYAEALAALQQARAADGGHVEAVADIDATIGAIHESVEQYPQAIAHARRALAVRERDPHGNRHVIRQDRSNLAQSLSFAGEHDEALRLIRAVVVGSATETGEGSFQHLLDRFRLVAALRCAGQAADAECELNDFAPAFAQLINDPEHPFHFYLKRLAAAIERDLGRDERARAGLADAIEFAARHPGADPVAVAIARTELAELRLASAPEAHSAQLAEALPLLRGMLPEHAPSRSAAEARAAHLPTPLGPADG